MTPALIDDCLRTVIHHCRHDYRTLGNLLTVNKAFFCWVVPILYTDPFLPEASENSKAKLGYTLYLSSGCLMAMYGPVIPKPIFWQDGPPTLPTTVNYCSFVATMSSSPLLSRWKQPMGGWNDVHDGQLMFHAKFHAEKFTEITIRSKQLELIIDFIPKMSNLKRLFLNCSGLRFIPQTTKDKLASVIRKHMQTYPGVLEEASTDYFFNGDKDLFWKLQGYLAEYRQLKSLVLVLNDEDMVNDWLLNVENLKALTLTVAISAENALESMRLFMASCKKLETLVICSCHNDAFSWANDEMIEWLRLQKNASLTKRATVATKTLASDYSLPNLWATDLVPVKSLNFSGNSVFIPDALSGFRNTLESVVINESGTSYRELTNAYLLTWNGYQMPRLKKLITTGVSIDVPCISASCPNLEELVISHTTISRHITSSTTLPLKLTILRLNMGASTFVEGLNINALKPLKQLESLYLYGAQEGKGQDPKPLANSITKENGWWFPNLRDVGLKGWYSAVFVRILAVGPRIEEFSYMGWWKNPGHQRVSIEDLLPTEGISTGTMAPQFSEFKIQPRKHLALRKLQLIQVRLIQPCFRDENEVDYESDNISNFGDNVIDDAEELDADSEMRSMDHSSSFSFVKAFSAKHREYRFPQLEHLSFVAVRGSVILKDLIHAVMGHENSKLEWIVLDGCGRWKVEYLKANFERIPFEDCKDRSRPKGVKNGHCIAKIDDVMYLQKQKECKKLLT